MKKLVCVFLIIAMMISVFAIPASARVSIYEDIPATEYKYQERVIEYIFGYDTGSYREFCYYSDENQEEPDWVLIVCQPMPEPWEMKYGVLVNDRILWTTSGSGIPRIRSGFTVYIPKTDTFIDLFTSTVPEVIEVCPNFVEALEENEIGQKIGDVNDDTEINILDATYIQRSIAEHYWDESNYHVMVHIYEGAPDIGDFDRDGEVTVMDATAIQRHIAGLE